MCLIDEKKKAEYICSTVAMPILVIRPLSSSNTGGRSDKSACPIAVVIPLITFFFYSSSVGTAQILSEKTTSTKIWTFSKREFSTYDYMDDALDDDEIHTLYHIDHTEHHI